MSIKRVITVTLLAQLLVEAVDDIEDNHSDLFRHGFKQKGKAFVDECGLLFKRVLVPFEDHHQIELYRMSTEIQDEIKRMINEITAK